MEVFQVPVKIPSLIAAGGVVPHGMVGISEVGVVRVPPVEEGEVQARPQPPLPGGLQVLPDKIPSCRGIGGLEIRIGAVKETESVVMLGGHDHILHPRPLGRIHPGAHIAVSGVEFLPIGVICFVGDALDAAHPLASGRNGIQSPMDEHSEPGPGVPGDPALIGLP